MARKNKKIYLDYAATTPVDSRVLRAMESFFSEKFGNTMSLHNFGQEAKVALEKSREVVADLMGAKPNEIIFTSSATESNNFVLKGMAFANKEKGKHIIISQIEHPCIMETADWLEKQGFKITRLPIAKRIWLGSNFIEEQAEPVEAAIPKRSSWITKDSPSIKENRKLALFGNLPAGWPFK